MKLRKLGIIGAAGALAISAAVPAFAQAPEDPLGVVAIPAGEPLHIGFWGVLSGADGSLGTDSLHGVELAVDAVGGKLLDRDIQLTSEDALCTPEGGATAATKMAADTTLVGLIGSSCSDETVGGIATLTSAGLTTISPSATRPTLTAPDRDPSYAGFLRTAHSDAFQGLAVAQWAKEKGITKAATIHDGSAYAEALQQVFADAFTEAGGTITDQEAVTKDQTDMHSVLTTIAASGPELIYLPIFTAAGAYIVAQSSEVEGLDGVTLAGSDGIFNPDFIKAAGPNVEGFFLSSPDFSKFGAGYADLLAAYKTKYGSDPTAVFHAHAYDATGILFQAIQKVATTDADGTTYIPKGALRDAIYATTDYPGIIGNLTCSASGDCGSPAIAIYEVSADNVANGTVPTVPVWPTGDSTASPAASPAG
ncbi:MAG: branched-chain amino acid ABC transporter substrate-binding protein [Chloroflexota bacterium]